MSKKYTGKIEDSPFFAGWATEEDIKDFARRFGDKKENNATSNLSSTELLEACLIVLTKMQKRKIITKISVTNIELAEKIKIYLNGNK